MAIEVEMTLIIQKNRTNIKKISRRENVLIIKYIVMKVTANKNTKHKKSVNTKKKLN